ncbi:MAG: hypothetical protein ACR9NN_20055 [Nostochopsis sp.]
MRDKLYSVQELDNSFFGISYEQVEFNYYAVSPPRSFGTPNQWRDCSGGKNRNRSQSIRGIAK